MPLPCTEPAQSNLSHPETSWLESADRQKLFYRYWAGKSQLPTVVYLHGIEGHSEWFTETASILNNTGMTIYAPDRRGAGANSGERGHLANYAQLLADLALVIKRAKKNDPESPIFLMGNCWGAKLAILATASFANSELAVSGLVLTSPAIKVKVDVNLWTKIAIGFSLLTRSLKRFSIPLTADMFTDNPIFLDYINSDPLRLTEATASFFFESLKLTRLARSKAARLRVPLLLLQSGVDQIVSVDDVRRWFDTVSSPDKTMHVFENAAHSLDFDAKRQDYVFLLSQWLKAHVARVVSS